jgi:subtilisin family serine protease
VDTDITPFYPSGYNLPNIISVASTDTADAKSSFSNFGATTVDIGAPGTNILSTVLNNGYGTKSGTSMATPVVTGAAVLLKAASIAAGKLGIARWPCSSAGLRAHGWLAAWMRAYTGERERLIVGNIGWGYLVWQWDMPTEGLHMKCEETNQRRV